MAVAVAHRSIVITKQLLEHGMDVNARYDLHGHTALHWAAELGGMDMASLVLQYKADTSLRHTAQHYKMRADMGI